LKAVEHDQRTQPGASLRRAPRTVQALLATVELLAVALTVLALVRGHSRALDWEYLGVLVGLSGVFEEGSRRVGRIRTLITAGPRPDVTTVWTLAGVLVLPAGFAALLAMLVGGYAWLRRQREAGELRYWRVYSTATAALGALIAGSFVHLERNGGSVGAAIVVVAAIAVYIAVSRVLVLLALGLNGTALTRTVVLGRWDDNALVLATSCLGYMTAQVIVDQPLLTVATLFPLMLIQRAALVRHLEEAASTDEKTQLLTPLAWRQRAQTELDSGMTNTAALLVLDLDHFKSVNDLHGHLIGDAALFASSARITAELRPSDIVGRFGGEEFVVLLPGLGTETALAVAERLRRRIGSIRLADLGAVHTEGGPCEHLLSASIGVAVHPQDAADLGTLLVSADNALYAAKRAGRDRVVVTSRGEGAEERTAG
jgi:diguanylate cyclase (GGDEF)-like protein